MSEENQIVATSNNLLMLMLIYFFLKTDFFLFFVKECLSNSKSIVKIGGLFYISNNAKKYQQILKILFSSFGMWELKIEVSVLKKASW